MTETNHERWSEDLAPYSLGALEPGEAAELAGHLAGCERCRAELRWLAPALQTLPESVERVEPPPQLRARLMAEVRSDPPAAGAGAGGERSGYRHRAAAWFRRLGSGPMGLRPVAGLAVAALVITVVGGFAVGGGLGGSGDATQSTIVAGKAPGIVAEMIEEGDGGSLHLDNVDQIGDRRVLEAWVQRDGEVEAVEALFVPNSDGRASTELPSMEGVEVVMVTVEPKGGSATPTGKPLIAIRVPT